MNENASEERSISDLEYITEKLDLLELENKQLRHRVEVLERSEDRRRGRSRARSSRNQYATGNSKRSSGVESTVPRKYRDKKGNRIDIGDNVYFVTAGRHNSRRGVVTRITDTYVYADDKEGVEQYRIAKNIRVESKGRK